MPSEKEAKARASLAEALSGLKKHGSDVVRIGPYELTKTLGKGNFGKVKEARHIETNQQYAVKVVDKRVLENDLPSNLDIRREMSILRALTHPNIVYLHEVMVSQSRVYLVMDLAKGGDFFKMISTRGRLEEPEARKYFRQLVDAVDHCHKRGVYHRDLKPENILLTDDGNLKVTDFGFSAMKDHGRTLLRTNCGSPHYCAPEVWNGSQQGYDGTKSDAFSIGVILYVLLAGGQPFYDDNEERLLQKVNRCHVQYPSWISADAKDLLTKLLVKDPKKRWSLPMVKRHIWYTTATPVLSTRELEPLPTSRVTYRDSATSSNASVGDRVIVPLEVAANSPMSIMY